MKKIIFTLLIIFAILPLLGCISTASIIDKLSTKIPSFNSGTTGTPDKPMVYQLWRMFETFFILSLLITILIILILKEKINFIHIVIIGFFVNAILAGLYIAFSHKHWIDISSMSFLAWSVPALIYYKIGEKK